MNEAYAFILSQQLGNNLLLVRGTNSDDVADQAVSAVQYAQGLSSLWRGERKLINHEEARWYDYQFDHEITCTVRVFDPRESSLADAVRYLHQESIG